MYDENFDAAVKRFNGTSALSQAQCNCRSRWGRFGFLARACTNRSDRPYTYLSAFACVHAIVYSLFCRIQERMRRAQPICAQAVTDQCQHTVHDEQVDVRANSIMHRCIFFLRNDELAAHANRNAFQWFFERNSGFCWKFHVSRFCALITVHFCDHRIFSIFLSFLPKVKLLLITYRIFDLTLSAIRLTENSIALGSQ